MDTKAASLLLILVFDFVNVTANNRTCYGDLCNRGKDVQFCSETFKLCRNCEEVTGSCGTYEQPLDCMLFCVEYLAEKKLERERARSCPVSPMMMIIADGKVDGEKNVKDGKLEAGSCLTYSCNDGFLLRGVHTLTCSSNGTWNQTAMPYCIDESYKNYKKIIILLSVICVVLGMVVLITTIVYVVKIRSMKTIPRSLTGSNLDEESFAETHSLLHGEGEETAPTEISTSDQDGSETNIDIGNSHTVESNANYPVEETTGGKSKGTKPLAARDGEQPKEVPLKMAEGPEVLPPEDTHENSPTKESEREDSTKDIGWQDRTYPVRDTLPDKGQTKSKQLVV